jgi:hypothetical protein
MFDPLISMFHLFDLCIAPPTCPESLRDLPPPLPLLLLQLLPHRSRNALLHCAIPLQSNLLHLNGAETNGLLLLLLLLLEAAHSRTSIGMLLLDSVLLCTVRRDSG